MFFTTCSHLLSTLLKLSSVFTNYKFCIWRQCWLVLVIYRVPGKMGEVGILLGPHLEYFWPCMNDSHTDSKSVFKARTPQYKPFF